MIIKALRAAFPVTLPIFAGYWFLGLSYGLCMHAAGFDWIYPMLMSMVIFGGSLEFVAVQMLLSPYAPAQVLVMSLLIQARHIFYGVSMLEIYRGTGWKKFYLIFGMTDETFAINYSAKVPAGVDKGWFMFFITLLNHFYWVSAATAGCLAGNLLPENIRGIGFVMTALFVVIFIEQWLKEKRHVSAFIGFFCALGALAIFGPESFMLPAMAAIALLLALLQKPIRKAEATSDH
ncbi:MAG: AzlC family ABC transporter permease [Succinivibrionaceae bacterium]|nr:AzlC family ABC transporter permease [Succinivibrionaceae bacterium]